MNRVNEMFGIYTNGSEFPDLHEALATQICPWHAKGNTCYKVRKSAASISIGTCSLCFQNIDQPLLICPARMKDKKRIFIDCLPFISDSIIGSELYLIPEVNTSVGSIDFMLVAADHGRVVDFVALELQTLDTVGSVWNDRQAMLIEQGYDVDPGESTSKHAGVNWKMTAKTILAQMVQKAELFDGMGKNLVLICQTPLYEYMEENFDFSKVHDKPRERDVLHFHMYDYHAVNNRMELSFAYSRSADLDAVRTIMGVSIDLSREYATLIETLSARLLPKYRFDPIAV